MTSFSTLQEIVASLAAHGSETALITFTKEGTERYSFLELVDLAQRLARGLLNAGLQPGANVLLFAPNQLEWIIACLALISARAVPVPIDVQISGDELRHILAQCEARWVCTTEALARRLAETGHRLNHILFHGEARAHP